MSTRRRRRRGGSDLGLRVLAAVPAVAFAIFIIVGGGWIFAAGALLLGLVCLHELFRMYDSLRPVRLAGFLAIGGLAVAALEGGDRQVLLALVAFVPVMFLLALAMPRRDGSTMTEGMAITTLGVVWVGMAIAHAILLRETPHGDGIIVDVLVGTFLGDSGAYFGGRWFGTRPLAPRISPNKTVEGLVIGFLTAVIFTWAAGLYQDWLTHGQALILGVAVGATAPLGDLFESAIKRDAGTKDAGTLFGAHGGALDRLDAAFFTLVTGYYVWLALMQCRSFRRLFNPTQSRIPLPFFFDAEPRWVQPWTAPWDWFRQLLVPWIVLGAPLGAMCLRLTLSSTREGFFKYTWRAAGHENLSVAARDPVPDFALLCALALWAAVLLIVLGLIADGIVSRLDPRVRMSHGRAW